MDDGIVLETERLVLRQWVAEDEQLVFELHARPDVVRHLPGGLPWTRAQAEAHLAGWIADYRTYGVAKLKLVRRQDGAFVGRAGFGWMEEMDEFELGYTIAPQHQGLGYATEIALALSRWFLRSRDRFVAITHVDNEASLRVMEKIGMRREASRVIQSLPCHVYGMRARDISG